MVGLTHHFAVGLMMNTHSCMSINTIMRSCNIIG